MKSNKIFSRLLLVLSIITILFVSCKPEKEDISKNVVGTYEGFLDLSIAGNSQGVIKSVIEITKVDDSNVSIKLRAFDYGQYKIADIVTESEVVKETDKKYKLSGKVLSEQTVKITGDFAGTVENKSLTMVYTFNFGSMPMPVIAKFSQENPSLPKGEYLIKATEYNQWTYLNVATGQQQVIDITDNPVMPDFEWDLAFHRYDIKTNNGTAAATDKNKLEDVTTVPLDGFAGDVNDSIIVDMSQMMEGIIVYANTNLNPVLNKWIAADFSQMPPIYTLSNLVYVFKTKNNIPIKLLFTDYTNEEGKKGFVKFSYEFMKTF